MPVRFHCSHCRQALSIARRKIGTTINCPRCFIPLMVPTASDSGIERDGDEDPRGFDDVDVVLQHAAVHGLPPVASPPPLPRTASSPAPPAAPSGDHSSPPVAGSGSVLPPNLPPPASPPPLPSSIPTAAVVALTSSVGSSDVGTAQDSPPTPALQTVLPLAEPVEATKSEAKPRSPTAPRTLVHPELVTNYLFVHRSALYLQLVVMLAMVTGAFSVGYLAGVQNWLRVQPASQTALLNNQATVLVSGSVTYQSANGRQPDVGAVVLILPLGGERHKLRLSGWKGASERGPLPDHVSEEVRTALGDVSLVKGDGSFELVVPQPGDYQLLMISANSKRPTGQLIDKQELEAMVEWFESPSSLIGWQMYSWQLQRIDDPAAPLEILVEPPR